jgi:hypothetical protein
VGVVGVNQSQIVRWSRVVKVEWFGLGDDDIDISILQKSGFDPAPGPTKVPPCSTSILTCHRPQPDQEKKVYKEKTFRVGG